MNMVVDVWTQGNRKSYCNRLCYIFYKTCVLGQIEYKKNYFEDFYDMFQFWQSISIYLIIVVFILETSSCRLPLGL